MNTSIKVSNLNSEVFPVLSYMEPVKLEPLVGAKSIVPVWFNPPVNRQQVRRLRKENERNFHLLLDIEDEFIDALFDSYDEEYSHLYQLFLEKYLKTIKWMKANKMFKYSIPNTDYFREKFYPIENFAA